MNDIIAFEIRDGRAMLCEYVGPERRFPLSPLPDWRIVGTDFYQKTEYRVESAHLFSNNKVRVWLYLPEGIKPTSEHCKMLERVVAFGSFCPIHCAYQPRPCESRAA